MYSLHEALVTFVRDRDLCETFFTLDEQYAQCEDRDTNPGIESFELLKLR